ncbi:Krr1-domain-containing protein [Backusella circina FSU 941]|nr:Krr1-domain-containing protein [Backusella circina FSU 941]
MSEFKVNVRTRSDDQEEYKRPELLKKAIAEVEAQVEKERELDDSESDYDSDDADEDDEAQLLTPAVDSQIFRTLAAIRSKDPSVYKADTQFFDQNDDTPVAVKSKKEKKVTLKDYERDILLKHGGYVEDEAEGVQEMTHHEEQEQLKSAFKMASLDDSDEEDDDLLVKKDKTQEEKDAEESDYRSFLLEHMTNDEASKSAVSEWKNYKNNPNVSQEDAFLMDYVLNRGWVDDKKKKENDDVDQQQQDMEKDEEDLDDVDCFESKYNFRFEEEGGTQIKTYPRDIEGSARRKESKRAKRREREKLNKQKKKEEKMLEMKQMKNIKMKEIQEKLREIQSITGNKTVGFEDIDFDGNFDPDAHDKKMQEIYNDEYYNDNTEGPLEKPVWDDDLDDDNFDYDHNEDAETKSANAEKFKNLMEEYYSLNYEDVVGGDTFTRFKYAKTEPEDYGLSAEDILLADDAALNKYIGMKQLAPYRPEKKKEYEMRAFEKSQKSKKRELKKHIEQVTGDMERKKRKIVKMENEVEVKLEQEDEVKLEQEDEVKKNKKRKRSSKKKVKLEVTEA